jgi:hypothetical protein
VAEPAEEGFPNMTVEDRSAVRQRTTTTQGYSSVGNVFQVIVDKIDNQKVAYPAFNEKLRAHKLIPELSAWKQKMTSGVWGTITRMPIGIAGMLGVVGPVSHQGEDMAKANNRAPTITEQTNAAAMMNPGDVASDNVVKAQHAGEKVVVGCKLGVAYYDIYLCRKETVKENTQTGPRDIVQFTPVRSSTVRLRGTAYPRGTTPEGFPEKPIIVEGAALNFDVDKGFWDEWVEQNKLNPLVMNKMLFAHVNVDHVKGLARDLKDQSSGLEPINPRKDGRMPKSTRADVSDVETEETRAKKMDRLSI